MCVFRLRARDRPQSHCTERLASYLLGVGWGGGKEEGEEEEEDEEGPEQMVLTPRLPGRGGEQKGRAGCTHRGSDSGFPFRLCGPGAAPEL